MGRVRLGSLKSSSKLKLEILNLVLPTDIGSDVSHLSLNLTVALVCF